LMAIYCPLSLPVSRLFKRSFIYRSLVRGQPSRGEQVNYRGYLNKRHIFLSTASVSRLVDISGALWGALGWVLSSSRCYCRAPPSSAERKPGFPKCQRFPTAGVSLQPYSSYDICTFRFLVSQVGRQASLPKTILEKGERHMGMFDPDVLQSIR
jgi:hypothetical protein